MPFDIGTGVNVLEAIAAKFVPLAKRSRANGVVNTAATRAFNDALEAELEDAIALFARELAAERIRPNTPPPPPRSKKDILWGRKPPPRPKPKPKAAPPPPVVPEPPPPLPLKPLLKPPKSKSRACLLS